MSWSPAPGMRIPRVRPTALQRIFHRISSRKLLKKQTLPPTSIVHRDSQTLEHTSTPWHILQDDFPRKVEDLDKVAEDNWKSWRTKQCEWRSWRPCDTFLRKSCDKGIPCLILAHYCSRRWFARGLSIACRLGWLEWGFWCCSFGGVFGKIILPRKWSWLRWSRWSNIVLEASFVSLYACEIVQICLLEEKTRKNFPKKSWSQWVNLIPIPLV